ncbi:MAG: dephospho-CoA kinase [Muribaculaceae bacterium]|nr:dephospho-CoA kinase [Muribaculaceae bacterium]
MARSIGITGGIGAGKSVVSRLLRLMGYPVFDCDSEAKRLMEEDSALRESLIGVLGKDAYTGRRLNREYVASRIFTDETVRNEVNRLVHEAVRNSFRDFRNSAVGIVFIETAILVTGGLLPLVDEVWLVDAPKEVRKRRVMARNALSDKKVEERMAVQKREFEFLPASVTRIIDNGGESSVWQQVVRLLEDAYRDSAPDSGYIPLHEFELKGY